MATTGGGEVILNEFRRDGVCTDHLRRVTGATSATASVLVRQRDGARSIVFYPGTVPALSATDVSDQVIASAEILHVNGRHWEACLQACRYARESGVKVSFDGGAHRYNPEISQLIQLTNICIVARDFAEQYAHATHVEQAAEALLIEGPELVIITDGVKGSWIYPHEGSPFHQPAYLLPNVVDTTGCGDSYHGAFLFGLVRNFDLKQIAALASAVAALNTQKLGGRGGLPTFEEVTAFLARV